MLKMMIGFMRDYWKYRHKVKRQDIWIQKYTKKNGYVLNPNWMMSTNLKVWLSEMDETFGKRYCPCFEPSGDAGLDKKMLCPCEFVEDEIEEYGTCHCALFGPADLSKEGWKASSKRLMEEYRVPLDLKDGVLDTRGMPMDPRRDLPIPDAMHQLKSTLNDYDEEELTMIVEREQEAKNLERIADYRGYGSEWSEKEGHFEVKLRFDGSSPTKGTNSSCGN